MADVVSLTPALRAMLDRIVRQSPLLETTIVASGSGELKKLRRLVSAGWVICVDHPTTIDRRTYRPARAYEPTDAGRRALYAVTEEERPILHWAARWPDTPLSAREISDKTGIFYDRVYSRLKSMEKRGIVEQRAKGFWAATDAGRGALSEH